MWGQMRDFLNIGALIGKGSVTFYLYVKRYGKKQIFFTYSLENQFAALIYGAYESKLHLHLNFVYQG